MVKGGGKMSDELIMQITLAMLERGSLYFDATDNEGLAKELAKFIKTLRNEINE